MSFFESIGLNSTQMSMRTIGGISPAVVNSLYPMEALTKFHQAHHIVGLTGRWMDLGGRALGGPFPGGPYHRLFYGHHLLRDGFTAIVNPDLKFGEFLHHLGCDFLTKTGINNPVLPVRGIAQHLIDQGFQQKFVNELLTLNAPKVLGGSLSLICSGKDVFMAFSDAIPHTFSAAGVHFAYGSLNLTFGCFPPNLLLLTAGVAEIGVGAITTYRTIVDPILPLVNVPGSVFFPMLKQSVLLASILGVCSSVFTGSGWEDITKTTFASAGSAGIATTASLIASRKALLAPFLGPMASIVSFIILKKLLDKITEPDDVCFKYQEYENIKPLQTIPDEMTFPLFALPEEPIGMLKEGKLLINETSIRDQAEIWICDPNQN